MSTEDMSLDDRINFIEKELNFLKESSVRALDEKVAMAIRRSGKQLAAKLEWLMKTSKMVIGKHAYAIPMIKSLRRLLYEFLDSGEALNDYEGGVGLLTSLSNSLTEAFAVLAQEGEEDNELIEIRKDVLMPLFNVLIENGARF